MKIERMQELNIEAKDLQVGDRFYIKIGGKDRQCSVISRDNERISCCFDEIWLYTNRLNNHLEEALQEIYDGMPEEWKERIPRESFDLLSIREVFGMDSEFNRCEGQLEFFKDMRNRVAVHEDGYTDWYWLKEAHGAPGSQFCSCGTCGFAGYDLASNANGYVRPRFVIA